MKKYLFTKASVLALIAVALIAVIPNNQTSAATPPDSCFNFNSGTETILNYYEYELDNNANPACTKDADIPATIGGTSVTTIASSAFYNSQLTSLTIPNSVTTIGNSAFTQNQLTSLTLGTSVVTIGNNAFQGSQLTSLTIPNSVTTIGDSAFTQNQLTTLTLGGSVATIDVHAFSNNQLTSLTIPNSVTSIGDSAFASNPITTLTLGNSVAAIGNYAFTQNQLTSLTIPNSVTSIGEAAFYSNDLTTLTLGNSVATIGFRAFSDNQLTTLTIPNSVTSIDNFAFSLNQLTSLTIPNSVTSIDNFAFALQTTISGDELFTAIGSGDPQVAQEAMDTIFFVLLFTTDPSNPNSLVDDNFTEADIGFDINGDGDDTDSLGGHLINPAQVTIQYEDGDGADISPSQTFTADGISDYFVSSNSSNDQSLYYRLGQAQSFEAPDITGYTLSSPSSPYQFTLTLQQNAFSFVYSAGSAASNGGSSSSNPLASTGSGAIAIVALSLALITTGGLAFTLKRALA